MRSDYNGGIAVSWKLSSLTDVAGEARPDITDEVPPRPLSFP